MKQFIKEAQRLQKLAGITEAKVVPQIMTRRLPKEDATLAEKFIDFFDVGDIAYSFKQNEPITIKYNPDNYDYENERNAQDAIKTLISKYKPGTVLLSNDIGNEFPSPKAPRNSFTTKIMIDKDEIIISFAHTDDNEDDNGEFKLTGWFDINGKYYDSNI